jgi:hypothetical protein
MLDWIREGAAVGRLRRGFPIFFWRGFFTRLFFIDMSLLRATRG